MMPAIVRFPSAHRAAVLLALGMSAAAPPPAAQPPSPAPAPLSAPSAALPGQPARDKPDVAPASATEPTERGDYADSFSGLSPSVREYERDPHNRYTYCIRNVATYECLSYGSDGQIRRRQHQATAHGTGFAYRETEGETLLLTNQHVASWPLVTDERHRVEEVPSGCKLLSEVLSIVDNEDDDYSADDIPLTRMVADEALDAAVVKAHAKLRLIPYRLGRASALSIGDVVMVRGFPLGVFQAYNTGKVVNPYDHDEYKDWDHVDFIIDAPLSSGNSGSPVLALSRRTGEYELVGLFHASYTGANALNAAIGIEQVRDLMFTLKPARERPTASMEVLQPPQRLELQQALAAPTFLPLLTFGSLHVAVRACGDALLFEVFSRSFPLDDRRIALLLDQPVAGDFGALAQLWFGSERGLKAYPIAALDSDAQARLRAVLRRLYALAMTTLRYRALSLSAATSREAVAARASLQRSLARMAAADQDQALSLADLASHLAPRSSDQAVTYESVLATLIPPPAPPSLQPEAKSIRP